VRALDRLGAWARAAARRPPDAHADRVVGLAIVATVPLLLGVPLLAPVPLVLAAAGLPARARRARARAEAQVVADLPDVVDLLVLAAGAGLTTVLAVEAVAQRTTGPVGVALAGARHRIRLGELPARALHDVPAATALPDAVRPLARALATAVEEGGPLEPALRRVAVDVRSRRRRAAEEAGRRIPVRLLFPLVACTLPAFVLLTVVPLLVVGLRTLDL
jgi:tight adherence protein C